MNRVCLGGFVKISFISTNSLWRYPLHYKWNFFFVATVERFRPGVFFPPKGPQQLLLSGSRSASVKIEVNGICTFLKHCAIYVVYIYMCVCVCVCVVVLRHVKDPKMAWKSSFRQNYRTTFSPTVPPSATRISRVVADVETPGGESGNV